MCVGVSGWVSVCVFMRVHAACLCLYVPVCLYVCLCMCACMDLYVCMHTCVHAYFSRLNTCVRVWGCAHARTQECRSWVYQRTHKPTPPETTSSPFPTIGDGHHVMAIFHSIPLEMKTLSLTYSQHSWTKSCEWVRNRKINWQFTRCIFFLLFFCNFTLSWLHTHRLRGDTWWRISSCPFTLWCRAFSVPPPSTRNFFRFFDSERERGEGGGAGLCVQSLNMGMRGKIGKNKCLYWLFSTQVCYFCI